MRFWLTRDYEGILDLHFRKPIRMEYHWESDNRRVAIDNTETYYENLKWEDEPMEVIILPKPDEKMLMLNPIYRAIYETGVSDARQIEKNKDAFQDQFKSFEEITKEKGGKIIDETDLFKRTPEEMREMGINFICGKGQGNVSMYFCKHICKWCQKEKEEENE